MTKRITLTALFVLSILVGAPQAHAQDSWTGHDKVLHLAAGATIAGAVSYATDSRMTGFAAGVAAAIVKEVYDSRHPLAHTASYRDLLVTVAGAGLATAVPGLTVFPGGFVYRRSF